MTRSARWRPGEPLVSNWHMPSMDFIIHRGTWNESRANTEGPLYFFNYDISRNKSMYRTRWRCRHALESQSPAGLTMSMTILRNVCRCRLVRFWKMSQFSSCNSLKPTAKWWFSSTDSSLYISANSESAKKNNSGECYRRVRLNTAHESPWTCPIIFLTAANPSTFTLTMARLIWLRC